MAELSQILYQSGALTGELFSFVVDKYGRKKLHIITHICICIIGMINAYSVSYFMFALSKASMGFFVAVGVVHNSFEFLLFNLLVIIASKWLIIDMFKTTKRNNSIIETRDNCPFTSTFKNLEWASTLSFWKVELYNNFIWSINNYVKIL